MTTQVGLGLAESTAEQFALLDAAMDNARAFADASRFVRIATVNTLAAYFVPPALAELKRLHPALVVRGRARLRSSTRSCADTRIQVPGRVTGKP
jgi:DNA-binding transcriptional LysR family regulator